MRIGIDIDDTISNTNDKMIEAAIRFDKEHVRGRGFKDPDAFSFMEMFYWSVIDVDNFYGQVHTAEFYSILEPIPYAAKVIARLYKEGHKIILITKRKNTFKIKHATKKWLKKNGFKYHKLILGGNKKGIICMENDIDLFIDNDKNNIIDAEDSNVECILKGTKFNKKYANYFNRIEDWVDIYRYLKGGR